MRFWRSAVKSRRVWPYRPKIQFLRIFSTGGQKRNDIDGGFKYVRVTLNDTGSNAQLGCVLYILTEPRLADATPPSAL